MSSFHNTHKSTSSLDATGVPSPLKRQNNAALVSAAFLIRQACYYQKTTVCQACTEDSTCSEAGLPFYGLCSTDFYSSTASPEVTAELNLRHPETEKPLIHCNSVQYIRSNTAACASIKTHEGRLISNKRVQRD